MLSNRKSDAILNNQKTAVILSEARLGPRIRDANTG
jgi:hypothetical protein